MAGVARRQLALRPPPVVRHERRRGGARQPPCIEGPAPRVEQNVKEFAEEHLDAVRLFAPPRQAALEDVRRLECVHVRCVSPAVQRAREADAAVVVAAAAAAVVAAAAAAVAALGGEDAACGDVDGVAVRQPARSRRRTDAAAPLSLVSACRRGRSRRRARQVQAENREGSVRAAISQTKLR